MMKNPQPYLDEKKSLHQGYEISIWPQYFSNLVDIVSSEKSFSRCLDSITSEISDFFHAQNLIILSRDRDRDGLKCISSLIGKQHRNHYSLEELGDIYRSFVEDRPLTTTNTTSLFEKLIKQAIAIPIKLAGETIGLMVLGYENVHSLTDQEVYLLQASTIPVGFTIENARRIERTEKERSSLNLVQESVQIGTPRDVTQIISQSEEVKKQLANVELERERWHAIFDSVDESILILDREENIIEANPASEILIGSTRDDIIGHKFESVFDLTSDRGLKLRGELSPIKTVLTTKESLEYLQAKFINAEGREIWVGFSLTPIRMNNSSVEDDQIIAVCRDISRLVELDRAKSDFVSMASHELRTPLTVINGYISLVSSGDLGNIDRPDMAHFKMVLTQIQRSTERLNNLVEDLLDVSRIEQPFSAKSCQPG
jgi:PAS domain S-box-containing protein